MALITSADELKLLRDGAPVHGIKKFRYDNISIRPSHIDNIVEIIFEELDVIEKSVEGSISVYAENTIYVAAVVKTITHSLNKIDIQVQVWDNNGELIIPNIAGNRTVNSVDITMSISGTFRTIIIG